MTQTKRILTLTLALLLALSALCALAEVNGSVAIDRANFPDAKFRAYVRQFDTNGNGKLSLAERKAVLSISVPNMGIASLKGIEYFTHLKNLLATGNKLRTLDVSKNRDLIGLLCSGNRLTELDVSQNRLLYAFACGNNRIKRIDVSRNKVLGALNCQNNRVRELTLGSKPNMTSLRVSGNRLKTVDIKKCPKLRAYLTEAPVEEDGTLVWGDDHQIVIDATTHLTAGRRVLYP